MQSGLGELTLALSLCPFFRAWIGAGLPFLIVFEGDFFFFCSAMDLWAQWGHPHIDQSKSGSKVLFFCGALGEQHRHFENGYATKASRTKKRSDTLCPSTRLKDTQFISVVLMSSSWEISFCSGLIFLIQNSPCIQKENPFSASIWESVKISSRVFYLVWHSSESLPRFGNEETSLISDLVVFFSPVTLPGVSSLYQLLISYGTDKVMYVHLVRGCHVSWWFWVPWEGKKRISHGKQLSRSGESL